MRTRTTTGLLATSLLGASLLLAACGSPGSGGGQAAPTSAGSSGGATAAAECSPVAGDQLVVLKDDKGLQNSDNIIPAINAKTASEHPEIVDLLNTVSAKLDTEKLIQLNKSVDIDRKTSTEVAKQFVADQGLAATDQVGDGAKIVVGAANFSENATLAAIYAAVLKSAGFDASSRTIGAREVYLPALEKGKDIQVVPEYAATLADFINGKVNGTDAASVATPDIDKTVAALTPLAEKVGLTMGAASAAQDQNAFAVTAAFAAEHKVTTLSELAAVCAGGVSLAGPPECPERPFCELGLTKTYGLNTTFKSYDFGLIGAAIRKGETALGLVLSSDGSLAS
ncbi:glycine betaine ABC transporter substrate-binding protein [Cellulomonas sp. HZM]|uniref:glycine betaine ABC transporter substrate-binding protein n=1 Tax=Cellulomonas sp. HZM TaxID=1454010 RepID=UPI000492F8CE|nr:glycine betaine ABC transporter substrate-binding protein [Cellulomonas sp. HZM]